MHFSYYIALGKNAILLYCLSLAVLKANTTDNRKINCTRLIDVMNVSLARWPIKRSKRTLTFGGLAAKKVCVCLGMNALHKSYLISQSNVPIVCTHRS